MDRRSFVTSALLSAGILAITLGAAHAALPAAALHDDLVRTEKDDIETVWWRRRWRRRHWRRWRRW